MVKKGGFTIKLVDAVTKEPFKEHTASDGKIYVEVEPDAEYFIRVQQHTERDVKYYFDVDGVDLGYSHSQCGSNTSDCGIWSLCDRKSSQTALKFAKREEESTCSNSHIPALWTGRVKVKVYEAVFSHMYDQDDCASEFQKGDVGYVVGVSDRNKSKGVLSVKGTTTESKRVNGGRKKYYKEGHLLETFTLNYCAAPGLILAGILPEPPAWEYVRMVKPFKREESEGGKELNIKPKKIRIEGVGGVIRAREYDYFDFSNLSDSESDVESVSSQDTE